MPVKAAMRSCCATSSAHAFSVSTLIGYGHKLIVEHTCGPERRRKLGKLGIEVVASPCTVWKADHVVVVVCHGPILVASLHPNVRAMTVTAKLLGLVRTIVIAGRQGEIEPFFSFD